MSLTCSVDLLSDAFHKRFWSQQTYRHVKLRITITNDGDTESPFVEFELLVPEDLVQDLSGDDWGPLNRQEVAGIIYYAWSDFGGTPILSAPGRFSMSAPVGLGGVIIPAGGQSSYRLGVNLKPYADSVTVLYRLDRRENPIGDFQSQKIDLTPYKPSL